MSTVENPACPECGTTPRGFEPRCPGCGASLTIGGYAEVENDSRHRRGTAAALVALAALPLALVGVAAGQYYLTVLKNGTVAAALYAGGILFFLLAFVLASKLPASTLHTTAQGILSPLGMRGALAAISVVLMLAAIALVNSPRMEVTSLVVWSLSLAVALVAAAPTANPLSAATKRWAHLKGSKELPRELAAVAIILAAGAALRLIGLEDYPSGIHGDETGHGLIAWSVLEGKGPNPFGTAFLGDRALYFYLEAPFLALFGRHLAGLRLFSALSGVAVLPLFYLLVRQMFGARVALLSLALLSGSAVHINYSRLGLNVMQITLMTCVSLYALWRGHQQRQRFWWLASGVSGAVAFYFAFGGAIVPVTIGLFLLYLLVSDYRHWRPTAFGGGLCLLGGAMTLLPIPVYMAGRNDHFTEHLTGRSIFNNWDQVASVHNATSPLEVLLGQLRANLFYFFTGADMGPFFGFTGQAMLSPVVGPLAALGLVLMIIRIRRPSYAVLTIWFWSVVLIGGVLTTNSPHSHRLLSAALPALVGAALVLDWLATLAKRLVAPRAEMALVLLAAAVPLVAGYSEATWYFGPAAQARPWEWGTVQGRYVAALGPQYRVYSLGTPNIYFDFSVTRFLAPDVEGDSMLNPGANLPADVSADKDLAFLVFSPMLAYLPTIQALYPESTVEEIRGRDNQLVFKAIKVPRSSLSPSKGLRADYGDFTRVESDAASLGGGASRYPVFPRWAGSIYLERSGSYAMGIQGNGEITVDGRPLGKSAEGQFSSGWHSIAIQARLSGPEDRVSLLWRPPNAQQSPIPDRWLDSRPLAGQLRGVWISGDGTSGERTDGTVGFRNLGALQPTRAPVDWTWTGTLNVPAAGEYRFSLNSSDKAEMTIDGGLVAVAGTENQGQRPGNMAVQLTSGPHSFIVHYRGRVDWGTVEALWAPPGREMQAIPPGVFGPPRAP